MIEGWTKDLAHAARALRRAPGFTVVTVVTLGLAIGVNTGVFSVVDAVLLNPLPYPDADRLVYISGSAPGSDRPGEFDVGREFYVQYSEQADLLEGIASEEKSVRVLCGHPQPGRQRRGIGPLFFAYVRSFLSCQGSRP